MTDNQPANQNSDQLEEVLLRAYYRGKDSKGYSEFEMRQDIRQVQALIDQAVLAGRQTEVSLIPNYGLEKPFDYACSDLNHSFNKCVDCYKQMRYAELNKLTSKGNQMKPNTLADTSADWLDTLFNNLDRYSNTRLKEKIAARIQQEVTAARIDEVARLPIEFNATRLQPFIEAYQVKRWAELKQQGEGKKQ